MLSFVAGCFTGIVIIGFITRVCPRFMEYFVKDTNELPIDVNYIINLIENGELKSKKLWEKIIFHVANDNLRIAVTANPNGWADSCINNSFIEISGIRYYFKLSKKDIKRLVSASSKAIRNTVMSDIQSTELKRLDDIIKNSTMGQLQ